MIPMIGITMSLENQQRQFIHRDYSDAVMRAGGSPVYIPYVGDQQIMDHIINQLDGLLLSGGGDIDPTLFGEEPHPGLGEIVPQRDQLEIELIQRFVQQKKPILGICRGCQILNIALGGDMYQDLYRQRENLLQHQQHAPRNHASHTIQIKEGSLLQQIFQETKVKVNSFHHQAVRKAAPILKVSAVAADGVIEAIEGSSSGLFILGVQWHPECMATTDQHSQKIFRTFVDACK